MKKEHSLISGNIFGTLIYFAVPIIIAQFLQCLYGAVDLMVVGKFGTTADVSGVSTGSQLMMMTTFWMSSLAMGITVLVGNKIGEGNNKEAGKVIGSGICLFSMICLLLMAIFIPGAKVISKLLQAPSESFDETVSYLRICSCGFLFIIAYNLIGCIFRGIGDSKTPMITVLISCILNIFADILLVGHYQLGTRGAAYATVFSQAISVLIILVIIRKKKLPIEMTVKDIKYNSKLILQELEIGMPIAIQDFLINITFMIILAVVNKLGVVASAAMGVGEKVCGFILLIPSSFSQSITAFVAQNVGAGQHDRNKKALYYAIITSFAIGVLMFFITSFYGNVLAGIFVDDVVVQNTAHSYLKAYAIDCMLTPIMFCMVGFFNGYAMTKFVMIQGIVIACTVRAPWAVIWGNIPNTSLFKIGLGTPLTTFVQITVCLLMYRRCLKNKRF